VNLLGKMIVFDGMDRAGKTTALFSLSEHLIKEHKVKIITTDKLIGNRIPSLVGHYPDEVVYMLFWQAIRETELTQIQPVLDLGGIALVDRHYLSNLAYDWWEDLDSDFKHTMDILYLSRCMQPDMLFLFTIPFEKFVERDDGDTKLDRHLFEAIQSGYLWWARKLENDGVDIIYIDGSSPMDEVAARVLLEVTERL